MLHSPTVSTCVQGFGAVLYNFDKSRLIKIHQFAETSGKTCVFVLPMSRLMTWAKYPFQTTKRAIIRKFRGIEHLLGSLCCFVIIMVVLRGDSTYKKVRNRQQWALLDFSRSSRSRLLEPFGATELTMNWNDKIRFIQEFHMTDC